MLRIPVYMHNVDRAQVFRPSAWAAFGTDDLMGADLKGADLTGVDLTGKKR
jgi:L-fucose isomerase